MSSGARLWLTALLGLVITQVSGCDDPCALFGPDSDLDGDGFACAVDCVDLSADIYPGAPELCDGWDNNCDGVLLPYEIDVDGDGYRSCGSIFEYDCGPTLPEVHPGAAEFCDGMDNDCNPATPVWPGDDIDADGDGASSCEDCDDTDPNRRPGAHEICDGIDSDCNGIGDANALLRHVAVASDAELSATAGFLANIYAVDQDVALAGFAARVSGFSASFGTSSPALQVLHWDDLSEQWIRLAAAPLLVPESGDWWRTRQTLEIGLMAGERYMVGVSGFVGSTTGVAAFSEEPGALPFGQVEHEAIIGADADPSTLVDADLSYLGVRWGQSLIWRTPSEIDQDGDGIMMCLDCDDAGAEICDGFDGDCDGALAPDEIDTDMDGWVSCAGDCDDTEMAVAPHEPESCDGIDMNCLPEGVGYTEVDQDGDGFSPCQGDCDDADPNVWPGAPELCDSIDQDCDGDTEDWRVDSDGDGVWNCFDCAPHVDWIAPGLEETCDSQIDLNCDGVVGTRMDFDGDGYRACEGDCDESDPWISPGVIEIPGDGIDNNCDGAVDGLVPSVRVTWNDFAIESLESFWGPADARRAKTGGEYVVFTRSADGSVIDLESLEVDPIVFGLADGSTPTWSDFTGSTKSEGALWLEASNAVQVVLASADPYVELDVQLVPEPTAFPASASAGAPSFGPTVDACEDLMTEPSTTQMLEVMGGPGYFPWVDFNDESALNIWALVDGFITGCDTAGAILPDGQVLNGCQTFPDPHAIVGFCRGLALSSPGVAASVSRVYWSRNNTGSDLLGTAMAGGEIALNTAFNFGADSMDAATITMAHEAAHTYTDAVGSVIVASPPVQQWHAEHTGLYGPLPSAPVTFDDLTTRASLQPAISSCGAYAAYDPSSGDTMSPLADLCGFAGGSLYGRRNAMEDIATWTAEAVGMVLEGNPAGFCDAIADSAVDVAQDDYVQLAKVLTLNMHGFLPIDVEYACAASLFPDWTPAAEGQSRIWTLADDIDGFDTDAVAPPIGAFEPGALDIQSTDELWTTVHLVDPVLSGTYVGLIPLDAPEVLSPMPYYYEAPLTESYFERRQPTGDGGNASCFFESSDNSVAGTHGRSFDGVALVVRNPVQTFGVAYGAPWKCAQILDADVDPPLVDFHEIDGSPVAFQAPTVLGP